MLYKIHAMSADSTAIEVASFDSEREAKRMMDNLYTIIKEGYILAIIPDETSRGSAERPAKYITDQFGNYTLVKG